MLYEGQDIWESKERTRQTRFNVGLVFQYPEYQLFEETVYKDISFGPKNMGLDEKEVDRRVRDAAAFVGLSDQVLQQSPFELSGGQKRRVAIAGVIAWSPLSSCWTSPLPVWTRWAWSPSSPISGTTMRPRTPPSSWSLTPWRRWPGPWIDW